MMSYLGLLWEIGLMERLNNGGVMVLASAHWIGETEFMQLFL